MAYIQQVTVDITPGNNKKTPIFNASQYDKGREFRANLVSDLVPYELDGTETLSIIVRKVDNTLVSMDIANVFGGKTYVDFLTTEQMCACAGYNFGELRIERNGERLGTGNFYLCVEEAPDEGGLISQSEINNLERQIDDYLDETLPDQIEEEVSEIAPAIIQEAIGDNYYNKSQTYSQTEVNEKLTDYEKTNDDKYILLSPAVVINGCRAIWARNNDMAFMSADANQTVRAYPITKGDKFIIRAFGYDRENFDCAVIGENLVSTTNAGTPMKQVILCGGSAYPSDYTNHIIAFTAEYSGYLYINQRNATGVESYAKKSEVVSVRNENCLIINNGNYKHLAYVGNGLFILREFTRRGPNNLFQLVHLGVGHVVKDAGFVESKSYMTASTDIVGPFSIDKTGWSGAQWTGGNHSVTVNGVACPTAEQLDLKVVVNNEEVTENGIYYGEVRFVAKNKLYFAQTIAGNTFTGATPAILETRVYNLTDTMSVEVFVELLDDVRFAKYYGMQYVNSNVVNVIVPNDEAIVDVDSLSNNYQMTNKQPDIILQYAGGEELHMILHPEGLGSYAHNAGTDGYGLVATYGKTYHTLISGETISTGAKLYWSGEYKFIV